MSNCCLCSSLAAANSREFWNQPVFETANFVVVPSLGSLVEGWVLIVPKSHFICMGALPANLWDEMTDLKASVAATLTVKYGEICVFEHGPCAPDRKVGCGVDHAHLHLLPVPPKLDLAGAAAVFLSPKDEWLSLAYEYCRSAFLDHADYLYVEQPLGAGRIMRGKALGSQIFRKAIAKELGKEDEFNWRDYPCLHNVRATIRTLQGSVRALA